MTSIVSFLLTGPMMTAPERRRQTLERMAADLVEAGIPNNDYDARSMLFGRYASLDVALLAGEARMLAYQDIVAREMSES